MSDKNSSMEKLRKEFRRAIAIAVKDLRIYCLKPPVILFGVVFPFFLFISFYIGKRGPIASSIPGLVGISLFFTSSNIAPAGMPFERMTKTFARYLCAPLSFSWVVFGKTIAGFVFGSLLAILPLIVGLVAFATRITSVTTLVFTVLVSAMCFSSLGTLVATVPTEVPGNVMTVLNFIRLPLLFISGIFIPLNEMPLWARALSSASPLTFANDLLKSSLGLSHHYPLWLDFAAVAGFGLAFYAIAVLLFKVSTSAS